MRHNCQHLPENLVEKMISDRAVRTAICKNSHFIFFHFYFAHYVKYPTAPFQKELFHLTERENITNLIVVAFRGSSKSTIFTMSYPIWAILGQQQKKFVLILCQTRTQAKQHMMNLKRELESNSLLKNDLGPFQEESDEWGSSSLVFSKLNARITAASSEQSIRGLRHNQYRPDLIIGDDVEDLSSTKTREGRQKTYQWLKGEVIPTGDKNTRVVIVGNMLHRDSLLMHLISDIKEGIINGEFKEYPLFDARGAIAWPGKYPNMEAVETEKKKIGNEISWQREYLLRIIPDEGQIIYPDWIKYYNRENDSRKLGYIASGIDPAISKSDSADYTAIVSAKIYEKGENLKIYILPNPINQKLNFPETVKILKQISATLKGRLFIENVAYQKSLAEQLRHENISAEEVSIQGQDKRARLAMISHLISGGKVLFPEKGAEQLIIQLLGFGIEKHDDLVDAFTLLINKIIEDDKKIIIPQIFFI